MYNISLARRTSVPFRYPDGIAHLVLGLWLCFTVRYSLYFYSLLSQYEVTLYQLVHWLPNSLVPASYSGHPGRYA